MKKIAFFIVIFVLAIASYAAAFIFIPVVLGDKAADEEWAEQGKKYEEASLYSQLSQKGYLTTEDINKIEEADDEGWTLIQAERDEIFSRHINSYKRYSAIYFGVFWSLVAIGYITFNIRKKRKLK